jgi:hypothetical protein
MVDGGGAVDPCQEFVSATLADRRRKLPEVFGADAGAGERLGQGAGLALARLLGAALIAECLSRLLVLEDEAISFGVVTEDLLADPP